MGDSFLKKICNASAVVIGVVLAIAACGKLFYPSEYIKTIDLSVGFFEVLFLVAILYFRNCWQLWLIAAVIFAGWGGYALYWHCAELPCACMGAKLNVPTGFSIVFDFFFFAVSLILGSFLGGRLAWVYFSILSSLMALLIGYAFADWVYTSVMARM